jgi:hypothetical protein
MMNDIFKRRFSELVTSGGQMPRQSGIGGYPDIVPNGAWRQWATSAQSLIQAVFGKGSPHDLNFTTLYGNCRGYVSEVDGLKAVFLSAKDDFEGGYVFDVDLRVSGEVFGDFVALARHSLSEGHKDVAAVLASAALEDALKRFAIAKQLDVGNKTMQDVINLLKSAGLVGGAQKALLDTMPKLRNAALHAQWDKLTEPDVNSIIGFVDAFVLTKFSC